MELDKEILAILFRFVKDMTIHEIDSGNSVIEVDYEKYVIELMTTFKEFLSE